MTQWNFCVSSVSHCLTSVINHCADVQNEFNGIRQVKQYVFKRQRISTIPNNSVSFTGAQSVAGLENPQPVESLILKNGHVLATSQGETLPIAENGGLSAHGGEGKDVPKARSAITGGEPRRFHLSRDTTSNPAGRIRGAKGPPAVFIERRRLAGPRAKLSDVRTPRKPGPKPEDFSINQKGVGEQKTRLPSSSTETQSTSTAPLRNVRLPSGKIIPGDVDSSTLAAEMQAYTLKEIGRNLAEASSSENLSASTSVIRARQVSSFKPKAPALRYHERHPEQTGAMNEKKEYNQDEIMADAADVDGDESDYVMETYVRMPAEMFDLQEQKNVGVLVLDSQPDIDDFYNDDSDTDSEIYDEEEDENGKSC
jgi:hypothetical protein